MLALLTATTALLYVLGAGLHLANVLRDRPRLERSGVLAMSAGAVVHVALLVSILVQLGTGALMVASGGLAAAGLALTAGYLFLSWRFELASLGSLVAPLSALSVMAFLARPGVAGSTKYDSALLPVHIGLAFLGTAAFVLGLVMAITYVVQERQLKQKRFSPWLRRLPSLDRLDTWIVRVVSAGFVVYTVSLLLGLFSQWRSAGLTLEVRSGLSLLTWVIYAIIIQARITAGWRGRKAALLIVFGAVCALGVVGVYLARPIA